MRGRKDPQATMLAFVDVEARVPLNHPLRTIKTVVDQALAALSPEFDQMYSVVGRPSIPPERVLKSSVLIALYAFAARGPSVSSWTITCCSAGFWT